MTERTLVDAARSGDAAAFTRLVQQYDDRMRAVAYRMVGDQMAMDDVLQVAYLRAFNAMDRFRGEAAFSTWLQRIVINCCHDSLRRSARRAEVPLDELGERLQATAGSHEDDYVRAQELHDALRTLPIDMRAAVVLVDGEGLSYAEAATALGVAPGTVASRLNRARAALRKRLDLPEEMGR